MNETAKRAYIEGAWKMAQHFLSTKGTLVPFTVMYDPNGDIFTLPPFNMDQKDLHIVRMNALARTIHAEFAMMVSEAWYATGKNGELIERPSLHPNRIETVVVQWKSKDSGTGVEVKRLVRTGKTATLGGVIKYPTTAETYNRFFDGLFETIQ